MTLLEISELDCINGECELEEECFENKKMLNLGYCYMAQELLKVMEEEG